MFHARNAFVVMNQFDAEPHGLARAARAGS